MNTWASEVNVSLSDRSYPVLIREGLLKHTGMLIRERLKPMRAAVLTDDMVGPIYLSQVTESLYHEGVSWVQMTLPHGEQTKTLASADRIYEFLKSNAINRTDVILTLGGGVIGDLGGFAAATWMRGIRFVQVPTSLLAQVDSSVGGKTAIDLPGGKNMVGAFHQPSLVICDPLTLDTLPDEFRRDGLGEVVKYGAAFDRELFETLEGTAPGSWEELRARMDWIIERCVRCKAGIVARDERDTGERMLLNFGHTIGHAVEACQGYAGLHHGEAVAAGMAAITRLSENAGLTEKGTASRLTALLEALSLPVEVPDIPMEELIGAIRRDKKSLGDTIRAVLLKEIGSCFAEEVEPEEFFASIRSVDG